MKIYPTVLVTNYQIVFQAEIFNCPHLLCTKIIFFLLSTSSVGMTVIQNLFSGSVLESYIGWFKGLVFN